MVDTGATYPCIGKEGSGLALSNSSIKMKGFFRNSQVISITQPVPMLITALGIQLETILAYMGKLDKTKNGNSPHTNIAIALHSDV